MLSPERRRHRVDPDNPDQGVDSPFYGAQSTGFAITSRHPLDPPPFNGGTDPEYLDALRQVRAKGIRPDLVGTLPATVPNVPNVPTSKLFDERRTAEQTLMGIFWAY